MRGATPVPGSLTYSDEVVPIPYASLLSMRFVHGERPEPAQLADLREAVGYERAEDDYPRAYNGYRHTVAARDEHERLVGWCATASDGVRHAFLVDVIVHPDHQRQGIGRGLLQRIADVEHKDGIEILHADFAAENAGFYAACGFATSAAGILRL